MDEIINTLAKFLRQNSSTLCMAWIASFMVIYGRELATLAKKVAKSWHFIFRVLFFVLICGFGYGLLGVYLSKLLNKQMIQLNSIWIIVATLGAFLLLGLIADKKKKI